MPADDSLISLWRSFEWSAKRCSSNRSCFLRWSAARKKRAACSDSAASWCIWWRGSRVWPASSWAPWPSTICQSQIMRYNSCCAPTLHRFQAHLSSYTVAAAMTPFLKKITEIALSKNTFPPQPWLLLFPSWQTFYNLLFFCLLVLHQRVLEQMR